MVKQTPEQYVKDRYPKACIQLESLGELNSPETILYLVRPQSNHSPYIASGVTEFEAWKNAMAQLRIKGIPKLTNKEYVKNFVPNARAEKQVQGNIKGLQKTYWLIRNGRDSGYMASGDTESKAWKAAKEFIERSIKPTDKKFPPYD